MCDCSETAKLFVNCGNKYWGWFCTHLNKWLVSNTIPYDEDTRNKKRYPHYHSEQDDLGL